MTNILFVDFIQNARFCASRAKEEKENERERERPN